MQFVYILIIFFSIFGIAWAWWSASDKSRVQYVEQYLAKPEVQQKLQAIAQETVDAVMAGSIKTNQPQSPQDRKYPN